MKDSEFWLGGALVLVLVATLAMFLRDALPTDPMFIEMVATLFGVLIAISLGEGFRSNREEKKAKSAENNLVEELRKILKEAEQGSIDELHSPLWISTKTTGVPDRIESELRKALVDAFVLFDIYNYEARQYREYRFTAIPEDGKVNDLHYRATDAKKRLATSARKVLEMAD